MAYNNDWDDVNGPFGEIEAGYESGYYSSDDEFNNGG